MKRRQTVGMKSPWRRILAAGIMVFCFCCLSLQIWIKTGSDNRQHPEAMHFDDDQARMPMLGIVVPLTAEEVDRALESVKRWPTSCSRITLSSVDLILYFAQEYPQELERDLRLVVESTSCFRKTRVVTAALHPEESYGHIMRSAQFYKLFLAPEVRTFFVDYGALAIVEWDTTIAQENSFGMLYSAAFTTNEPFWVKGSRLAKTHFDENTASPEMSYRLDELNRNAIYNNTDYEFVEFINFTLSRWQYTRPYDVALWATVSDYSYSWSLWHRYVSKFVSSGMVTVVEISEEKEDATDLIAPEALFVRKRAEGTDKKPKPVASQSFGCHEDCGSWRKVAEDDILSTVCDSTCVDNHSGIGRRFNGHNCGAGDSSAYGESCRLCYKDRYAALIADQALASSIENAWTSDDHVIMCETKQPPEAIDCHRKCADHVNTVCDNRCGHGRYGDWHCNWRNLGEKCRFCFRDIAEALRADRIAQEAGGRVIMCETHEPPPERREMERAAGIRFVTPTVDLGPSTVESSPVDRMSSEDPLLHLNPSQIPFIGDVTRGNICIFIPGYFEFFHEARLAVDTIMEFMPGVRVVIATHPMDYHVYNRALGETNAAVSIVNNTRVDYASLAADEACGNETRLIYYMGPGEVLSRPFTAHDTHSPKGDLIVKHTDAELAGGEHSRRCKGTTALLGFHGLSFTYGADLILPGNINANLRAVLRDAMAASGTTETIEGCEQEGSATCAFHEILDLMSTDHMAYASIFIPEVYMLSRQAYDDVPRLSTNLALLSASQLLAALLYERNLEGVQFVDSRNQEHLSSPEPTIWDAPSVKPRFGCSIDLSLTLQGYDVADQLSKHIEAFRNGARCDRGFVSVDPSTLKLKAEWEFPKDLPSSRMPPLRDFRISVMYRTFRGDLELFKVSFPTAIKHIPDALEIVVVVEEADKELFEEELTSHRHSAPFPLRVVVEPSLMDGHIQQKYSKMRADLYTEGDYILHLDSDVLVLHHVTYEDIFHLGKPVLPFRRHRDDSREGRGLISCWQNATSNAVGEDVLHEFSIFNTHVYPRQMYRALRNFVEKRHGTSFQEYMSTRVGRCQSPSKWPAEKRSRLLSDFNLMGAFLWYHMPEAMYWMPADPYDLRPDQFRVDLLRYNWVCQANGRFLPEDAAGKEQFKRDFLSVTNTHQCNIVVLQWRQRSMKSPETRTQISREGW